LTRRTFTLPNDAWTVVDPRATQGQDATGRAEQERFSVVAASAA
jgi:hypothetical protein